ncbi:hypothetical protein FLAG1_11501 [Fusarium langsethiae]|uniref:Uncharacterized protein n=1 Tax=Fusarium langsethiae TaxID=179993 RepID=A0A0M9ELZ3_FUSLA|nr:hypothetical protein FLAG1_11501 [Fusarium langsethiae]GKU08025.1 unnamed protein product [Fusarium langsethiae]
MAHGSQGSLHAARKVSDALQESAADNQVHDSHSEPRAWKVHYRNSCVASCPGMRQEATVGDVMPTTSFRAHVPSSRVDVHSRQYLVLSEKLLGHKAEMRDAMEAERGNASDAVVDVAADGDPQQEDRAQVHDGDDWTRHAVARAHREKSSAELNNTR